MDRSATTVHLASTLLSRSGLAALARRLLARRGRFVLELHGVAAHRRPELPASVQPSFVRDELAALLTWLADRFTFLDPETFLRGALPGDVPGVLLTFDDGFANNVENALPLLEAHRAPAVFFVATRHVDDPTDWLPSVRRGLKGLDVSLSPELRHDLFDGLSPGDLRRAVASGLVTVGAHTVDHPRLTTLDDARLAHELGASKRRLEEIVERPVELFAYPYGDYDRRVAAAVAAAGYRAAFVEDAHGLGLGVLEIPRIGLYGAEPAYLDVKLSGLHRRPLREGDLAVLD